MSQSRNVDTGGGASITGDVNTQTFIGRDLITITHHHVERFKTTLLEESQDIEDSECIPLPSTKYTLTNAHALQGVRRVIQADHTTDDIQRIIHKTTAGDRGRP
jgi:transcriptional/translational regulatory protein YebC/TACO1